MVVENSYDRILCSLSVSIPIPSQTKLPMVMNDSLRSKTMDCMLYLHGGYLISFCLRRTNRQKMPPNQMSSESSKTISLICLSGRKKRWVVKKSYVQSCVVVKGEGEE